MYVTLAAAAVALATAAVALNAAALAIATIAIAAADLAAAAFDRDDHSHADGQWQRERPLRNLELAAGRRHYCWR